MSEGEVSKETKKAKGAIPQFLSRWLGKYVDIGEGETDKRVSRLIRAGRDGALGVAAGFLFAGAEGYGRTLPFGLALICGSERRTLSMLVGVLLSCLRSDARSIYFVSAVLIAVLRVLVCYILEGKSGKLFSEPMAIRLAVGAAGGFVAGIYRIFAGGFVELQLYEAIFLIVSVPLCAYLYSGALGRLEKGNGRRELGMFSLYCTLLLSLKSYSLFGFSPATVAAALMTLVTASLSGSIRGGLIGMASGLCLGAPYAALFGIVGAITGRLKRYSQIIAVGGGCACGAIFSLIAEGGVSLMTTVPAILWGGAICLPLSRFGGIGRLAFFSGRGSISEDASSNAMLVSKKEEAMTLRLNALSEAMTSLSGVFYALSNRLSTPGAWQVREVCEGSFKKYCRSCPETHICWGRNYDRTADVMNKLASAVARHGSADSSYIPSDFLTSCPSAMKALSEINLSHARLLESAARQNKTEVFALDYEAMAKLLEEASEENSSEYILDARLTDRARSAAIDMGIGFSGIAVYGKRKKTLVAGGVDLRGASLSSAEMRKSFEEACGIPLSMPDIKVDGELTTVTATARRVIRCEAARATSKKKDEEANGDSAIVFENREDRYYALISDGMGSGTEASMTSRMTGIFLSKLLSAGNRKHTVLKMLNNFIRNKNLECFATVDLLEIDLLTSNASFTKSGAAASYIIRSGRLFKIASASLPIGITREIASEEVSFKLEGGDLVIMVSDGVSQSFEDGAWLLSMLSEEISADDSLTSISRRILERAKKKNERSDDMTAVVIRVESLELS